MMIYSIDNMQKLLKYLDFYFYQASVAFMKDDVCVIGHWSPAKNIRTLSCPAPVSNEPFSSL